MARADVLGLVVCFFVFGGVVGGWGQRKEEVERVELSSIDRRFLSLSSSPSLSLALFSIACYKQSDAVSFDAAAASHAKERSVAERKKRERKNERVLNRHFFATRRCRLCFLHRFFLVSPANAPAARGYSACRRRRPWCELEKINEVEREKESDEEMMNSASFFFFPFRRESEAALDLF